MACLYCGKEIGPIRLIRDSEFCTAKHRKEYQERLRKVLIQVGEPHTVARKMATFATAFPLQDGNLERATAPLNFSTATHSAQIAESFNLTIPPVLGQEFAEIGMEPRVGGALEPRGFRATAYRYRGQTRAVHPPALPSPRLGPAVLPQPAAPATIQTPESLPASAPHEQGGWLAFGAFLKTPDRLPPVQGESAVAKQPLSGPVVLDYRVAKTAARAASWASSHAPLPMAAPALPSIAMPAAACDEIAAESGPVTPPPFVESMMASPAAEAVACWVQPCVAGAVRAPLALSFPSAGAAELHAHPGSTETFQPAPAAEAVAVEVLHREQTTAIALPFASTIPQLDRLRLSEVRLPSGRSSALPVPEAEPAERCVLPAEVLRPAAFGPTPLQLRPLTIQPANEMFAHSQIAARLALETASAADAPAAPMRPVSTPAAFHPAASLRMPQLVAESLVQQPACAPAAFETLQASALTPDQAGSNAPALLEPVSLIPVSIPEPAAPPAETQIPQADFCSVNYHCARGPMQASATVRPVISPVALGMPRLAVRLVVDRHEETRIEKEPEEKQEFAEVFTMPEAAALRRRKSALRHALTAIAASLFVAVGLSLGLGVSNLSKLALERDASEEIAAATRSSRGPGFGPGFGAMGQSAGRKAGGVLTWIRSAAAQRAAVELTDSFKNGMEAWNTESKAWAAGWSRNPDGYVRPGQLALFQPTLRYTDYRMDFFGQIESKGMSWVVRARDSQNYYAMKFAVVAPGLRPILSMVHYPVIGGKRGHKVETPLSMMVHNNTPYHVAVEVKGNRFVTSIEGQEVDSWTDEALPSGGVGFFSEAGERARLYWMKVSKNDDWLGRICAYLAGSEDGPRDTAWFDRGELPQPAPERAPAPPSEAAIFAGDAGEFIISTPQRAGRSSTGRMRSS